MKHLISLKEQSKEDILEILNIAGILKNSGKDSKVPEITGPSPCRDKKMLMLFEKGSTRTYISFAAAAFDLGMHPIPVNSSATQLNSMNFADEIKTMMLYGDAFVYRALNVRNVEYAASLNMIPVIDACSNKYHPAQSLTDIFTMAEISGGIEKIGKVVWLGIENNVSNTLALLCAKLGIHIYIVSPMVDPDSVDKDLQHMLESSSFVHRTLDVGEALQDANFVHTDTWMNMEYFDKEAIKSEFKEEFERRKELFFPYQLSASLLKKYNCNAKIMHCMPCHEGYEITRDAMDHPNSVLFQQAKNRYHTEKGILWWMFKK